MPHQLPKSTDIWRISLQWIRAIPPFLVFPVVATMIVSWGNITVRRYSHGDGSFKFLRAYFEHQQKYPLSIWHNDQVTREYLNSLTEFMARISIFFMHGKLYDSFTLFLLIHAFVTCLLYFGIFLFLIRKLPNQIALPVIAGICCLFGFSSSFPDAEILLASPIILWVSISVLELVLKQKYSLNNIFVLGFLIIFGRGIHEALILVIAIITLILVSWVFLGKIPNTGRNILTLYTLLIFSVFGSNQLLLNSSRAPTRESILHAAIFNPSEILRQPIVFLIFLVTIYSFLRYIKIKKIENKKYSLPIKSKVISVFAVLTLSISLSLLEAKRTETHWSFTSNRIDLMWFVILVSVLLPQLIRKSLETKMYPNRSKPPTKTLVSCILAMLILRGMETGNWVDCKERQATKVQTEVGVLTRSDWPLSTCDWGWTDPGTYVLINNEVVFKSLPPGDDEVIPKPEILENGTIMVFNFLIRTNQ